jgi:hypothetical protein
MSFQICGFSPDGMRAAIDALPELRTALGHPVSVQIHPYEGSFIIDLLLLGLSDRLREWEETDGQCFAS